MEVEAGLAVQAARVVLAHTVRHGRPAGRERPELAARRVPEAEAPAMRDVFNASWTHSTRARTAGVRSELLVKH